MMDIHHAGPDHLNQGELLALLDGEVAAPDREAADGHVASCAACREEMAAVQQTAEGLRRLLDRAFPGTDVQWVPPARRRRAWISGGRTRWAVAAGIIGLIALSAPPVRAWVAGAWTAIVAAVSRSEPAQPSAPPGATPSPSVVDEAMPANRVVFRVTGPSFTVRFPSFAAGRLTVVPGDQEEGWIASTDGDAGEIIVGSNRLTVVADASPHVTGYTLTLPSPTRTLTVVVGGRRVTRDVGEETWVIRLDG